MAGVTVQSAHGAERVIAGPRFRNLLDALQRKKNSTAGGANRVKSMRGAKPRDSRRCLIIVRSRSAAQRDSNVR